jgi:hypothetical protein
VSLPRHYRREPAPFLTLSNPSAPPPADGPFAKTIASLDRSIAKHEADARKLAMEREARERAEARGLTLHREHLELTK